MVTQIGPIPEGRSTGSAVTVDTSQVDALLSAVRGQLGRSPRLAAEAVGSATVEYLRAEPPPIQRVLTGHMRRSWSWRLRGRGGTRVEIGNTARSDTGYAYPRRINRRYRVAQRVMAKHRREIVEAAVADVRDGIKQAATTRQLSR